MAGSGNSCQALFRDKGVFIMTNKKKTSRQKRTLIGAVCVAAVIMAGSTFAWFSSQDEVTNRLTAKGNYGVTIAENFVPPQNIVPGQEVTKEVMATNTGNIAALVRFGLINSLKGNVISSAAPETSDTKYVQLGDYNFAEATKTTPGSTVPNTYNASNSFYNELADVMAGGYLVYTPTVDAGKKIEFSDPSGTITDKVTITSQVNNVKDDATSGAAVKVTSGWVLNADAPKGYYIFRRQVDINDTTYAYSGFWYDGAEKYYRLAMNAGDDTFAGTNTATFPDENKPADMAATITGVTVGDNGVVTLANDSPKLQTLRALNFTDSGTTKDTISAVLWNSTNGISSAAASTTTELDEILVTVDVGGDDTTTNENGLKNDLVFHLKLSSPFKLTAANTDRFTSDDNNWTAVLDNTFSPIDWTKGDKPYASGTANLGYIYYNYKLDPGQTTPKLVTSVTLDENCPGGYANFDYDIDVLLDSIQISYDKNNNEIAPNGEDLTSNKSTAANVAGWGVDAEVTDSNAAISSIAWSKTATS